MAAAAAPPRPAPAAEAAAAAAEALPAAAEAAAAADAVDWPAEPAEELATQQNTLLMLPTPLLFQDTYCKLLILQAMLNMLIDCMPLLTLTANAEHPD